MPIETRTITVGSVSSKSGVSNGRSWTRFVLLDDDDKVVGSTFDAALGKSLANFSGSVVEAEVDVKDGERGKLYDLKAVRLANPADARSTSAGPTPAEKHGTIAREVALKAAVGYATIGSYAPAAGDPLGQLRKDMSVNEVLIIADKFLAWILGNEP